MWLIDDDERPRDRESRYKSSKIKQRGARRSEVPRSMSRDDAQKSIGVSDGSPPPQEALVGYTRVAAEVYQHSPGVCIRLSKRNQSRSFNVVFKLRKLT